ncbi:MAG: cytochrome c-type biogenesis protein CcmH/NrfG [Glaciecola sp.]|jgi:cytochrome c-type biogenesis protein CcmH/NrfG
MLRTNRLLPTLACLLLGVSACVSTPKADPETRRLALLATSHGDWADAMDLWNGLLVSQRGRDPEARLHLGEALLESDRARGAIQVLRAEPPAEGTEVPYGLLLAKAHFSQGQIRAGGQVLSELLKDHAGNVEVLTLYGRALLGGDREARGLGLLLQVLRIDGQDAALAEEVAQRAALLGLADMEGEAWTLRLNAIDPPAEAYVGAAIWDLAKAQSGATEPLPKTILALQRALEIDPQQGRAWTLIGKLHQSQGRAVEARQAYRKAVEVDPGDWDACLALAEMFVALEDCIEAKIWIEHALGALTGELEREPFEELLQACD